MDKEQKAKLAWVNRLIDLMEERSLGELEVDHLGEKVRLAKAGEVVHAPVRAPVVAPAEDNLSEIAVSEGSHDEQWKSHPGVVKSPIVGIVYLSENPSASPFVSTGDQVKEGQTLLIVEAMKVMNPIQAHRSGVVKELLVTNEQPVEYGQVLAVIE